MELAEQFEPGHYVRLPACPEWGIGQVQTVVDDKVTVNFEHAGKVVVRLSAAKLELVED